MSKRPGAVVTIVQDEPVFLPIWLRYYSRFYGQDDLYVLDHGSTDGSTDGPGFVRVPLSHPTHDVAWMRDMMQRQQHELLESYRTVICVDVDEIVAPDPTQGTLADYERSARIAKWTANKNLFSLIIRIHHHPFV